MGNLPKMQLNEDYQFWFQNLISCAFIECECEMV